MAFSQGLRAAAARFSHEASVGSKVEIRRLVMAEIAEPKVFDAFAGPGQMWEAVWREAADYVGCDRTWYRDGRLVFVADNRRVLRSIDLSRFNIFDLDSFGNPWEQALIIAGRRKLAPGERIGLVLTEGSGLNLKQGSVPKGLQVAAGVKGRISGANRLHDELIGRAIKRVVGQMGGKVTRRWQAERPARSSMKYIGLVIEGAAAANDAGAAALESMPRPSGRSRR